MTTELLDQLSYLGIPEAKSGEFCEARDTLVDVVPHRLALIVVTGSHAYGTARPDSDIDMRGVFAWDTAETWKLSQPSDTVDRKDPDVSAFEVLKFCRLATAANPNVLEMLWAPVVQEDAIGAALRERRSLFLSRRALKTYGGYAISQLGHLERGSGGSRGQKHYQREKFVLHLLRLLMQGEGLLRTGDAQVRLDDVQLALIDQYRDAPLEDVKDVFDTLYARMKQAAEESPLPEEPDVDGINRLLRSVRLACLET